MNEIVLLDVAYNAIKGSSCEFKDEVLELLNNLILDKGVNEEAILFHTKNK